MKVRRQKLLRRILSPSVARGVAALCAAVFVASAPMTARAAGVVGTGTPDSCTDAALDTALAGGGLVTFNCGSAPVTIDISSPGTGTKTISADTIIDGGGLITISGGNSVRVFSVNPSVDFTVENVTIADGVECEGGGIGNSGTLTVTNSTLTGNSAASLGESGIDGCSGGAIANESGGTVTVTNSTFTGNSALDGFGGAITNDGTLTVTNCTFTGNSALWAGAISSSGSGKMLTFTNSTFTGNSAGYEGHGGGIIQINTSAVFRNTVVANSPHGDNCVGGTNTIIDGGHNLDDGTTCGFSTANGSLSNTDPQLDPAGLQNNGGPTQTVALCTGGGVPAGCTAASPAIDAGDPAVCAAAPVNNLDQRGFVRPGTGHTTCSMGAYEADASAPELCMGDCDGNGLVAINELVLGVNIVLGVDPETACLAFANSLELVDIAQIITGVNNALTGCAVPSPTPCVAGCCGLSGCH